MNRHDDHRYLVALRKGDGRILEDLYSFYAPQVLSWVTTNSGTSADAKDVFQEALLALHTKACDPTFELNYPIGGLIMQICKNKWIDQLRKQKKETEVRNIEKIRYDSNQEWAPIYEAIEEEENQQKILQSSFESLSELCQSLLKLVADGLSATDIASKLEMNDANTVYRRKNACISRWKQLYNNP